jgi:hypothetical protein
VKVACFIQWTLAVIKMKKEIDLEKLKNKKQLNVQEQNALSQYYIEQNAVHFRHHKDLPPVLLAYFESQHIDLNRDILLWYDKMPYGGPTDGYRGLWLTQKYRFIKYLIFLDESDREIDEVDEWKDVTNEIEVNAHTKGRGNSYGQLCINVLNKINDKQLTPHKADN